MIYLLGPLLNMAESFSGNASDLRKEFVDWHWAVTDIFTVFVAIMLLLTVDSTVLGSFVQLGHYALLNMEDKVVFLLIAAFDLE